MVQARLIKEREKGEQEKVSKEKEKEKEDENKNGSKVESENECESENNNNQSELSDGLSQSRKLSKEDIDLYILSESQLLDNDYPNSTTRYLNPNIIYSPNFVHTTRLKKFPLVVGIDCEMV